MGTLGLSHYVQLTKGSTLSMLKVLDITALTVQVQGIEITDYYPSRYLRKEIRFVEEVKP